MTSDKDKRWDDGRRVEEERRRAHGSPTPPAQGERGEEHGGEPIRTSAHSQGHPPAHARETESRSGDSNEKYEGWSRDQLYDKARELGLEGRSKLTKLELLQALRRH